ncbi:hypothetical protein HBH97_254470 [Parastagonospora nodorum]|nr:hypothetical protein HBH97_254470 [Parastagonospora nodorum]
MSLPTRVPASSSQRSDSPKRRRTDESDDVHPEQSASQLGCDTRLALNHTNTFSPPTSRVSSTPKRSSSPTRETPIILRSAWPPVITESLNGLKESPPEHADSLGDWLAEGVDFGFIPQGLQHTIKTDPDVGYQIIKPGDFDRNDRHCAGEMLTLWQDVKEVFLDARNCKDGSCDENAWCGDVVRPLVHLAMRLYGNNKWWFQNVFVDP